MPPSRNQDDPFIAALAAAIDRDALLAPGETVLVGVSGGLDSVAMLVGLSGLASDPQREYELLAGHLDHGLREQSADDAAFVSDLAGRLGVPCTIGRADTAEAAERFGEGIEQAARALRYDFFRKTAEDCGASAVAVAHHADDNVETILFRLLRGSSWRGLAGMPICRPLSEGPVRLIRPMLGLRREEIEAYAQRADLAWREDHTNEDPGFRRNFLRHELLPSVRENVNSKVDEALLRLGAFASETEEYLHRQGRALLERSVAHRQSDRVLIDTAMFAPAEPIVRRTALRLALEQLGIAQRDLSAAHLAEIDALVETGGAQTDGNAANLPGGFHARLRGSQLILSTQPVE